MASRNGNPLTFSPSRRFLIYAMRYALVSRVYKVAGWIGGVGEHGRGTALLHARTETGWFRICWEKATIILFMAKCLTFVKPDGMPCTTRSGDRANSGAPDSGNERRSPTWRKAK